MEHSLSLSLSCLPGTQHGGVACADGGANRLFDALTVQERTESVRATSSTFATERCHCIVGLVGNAVLEIFMFFFLQCCYSYFNGLCSTISVVCFGMSSCWALLRPL